MYDIMISVNSFCIWLYIYQGLHLIHIVIYLMLLQHVEFFFLEFTLKLFLHAGIPKGQERFWIRAFSYSSYFLKFNMFQLLELSGSKAPETQSYSCSYWEKKKSYQDIKLNTADMGYR